MRLTVIVFVLAALGAPAGAQHYPAKPVRIIAASGPGPSTMVTQVVAEALGKRLGGSFFVENRPGSFGITGTKDVITSAPDGYTLLVGVNANLVGTLAMQKTPSYDPLESLEMVAFMARFPLLVAAKEGGTETLRQLIAQGKAAPRTLNWGFANSMGRIAGAQLLRRASIEAEAIPYVREGEAGVVTALLSNTVHFGLLLGPTAMGGVESGKLRALALAGKERSPFFPDTPTIAEAGVAGFRDIEGVVALAGPKGMPAHITDTLAAALKQILDDPEVRRRLRHIATKPYFAGQGELRAWVKNHRNLWNSIIDENGIERQ